MNSKHDAQNIVCVSAFNESKSIYDTRVIIVYDGSNDGSKDDTHEIAASTGATVIRNQEYKTNGFAMRSLFQAAKEQDMYTLIAFFKGKMKYWK